MNIFFKNPLRFFFKTAAEKKLAAAEKALKLWGVAYEKKPDGMLFVPGSLDISCRGLTMLPDLSSVAVGGHFACDMNELTSLEGAPQSVGGNVWCYKNQLKSLKGAPQSIGGHFYCHENQLTSLEGAPKSVGGDFYCPENQLTSLQSAPKTFEKLISDFGAFTSWEQVPEELRLSPATRARLEEELAAISEAATVVQAPIKISQPLRLKSKGSIKAIKGVGVN